MNETLFDRMFTDNCRFMRNRDSIEITEAWLALSTNNPVKDGRFDELSANGYHRILIAYRGDGYNGIGDLYNSSVDPNVIQLENSSQIQWPVAFSEKCVVKGFAVFSADVDGVLLWVGSMDYDVEVDGSSIVAFVPSTFRLRKEAIDINYDIMSDQERGIYNKVVSYFPEETCDINFKRINGQESVFLIKHKQTNQQE